MKKIKQSAPIEIEPDIEKAQSSALYPRTLAYALEKAMEYRKMAHDFESKALLHAYKAGSFFTKAKRENKRLRGGGWIKLLTITLKCTQEEKSVRKKAVRTVQDYMRIAKNWSSLERVIEKHPNLSIALALRYLRTGTIEAKEPKSFDYVDFELSLAWTQMLKKTWRRWTDEEKQMMRMNDDLFKEALEDLRWKLHRINTDPSKIREYYRREEFNARIRKMEAVAVENLRRRLRHHREALNSLNTKEEALACVIPMKDIIYIGISDPIARLDTIMAPDDLTESKEL